MFYLFTDLLTAMYNVRNERYICPKHCGKTFVQKGSLVRHLKYECGVIKQFQCEKCLNRFCYKFQLQKHIKRKHHKIGATNSTRNWRRLV